MMKWQVNEAKSRFADLIRQAEKNGPQVITRHGADKVVVLSIEEYLRLKAVQPNFKDYLLAGPRLDDFEVDRPDDRGRKIEL